MTNKTKPKQNFKTRDDLALEFMPLQRRRFTFSVIFVYSALAKVCRRRRYNLIRQVVSNQHLSTTLTSPKR